MKKLTTLEWVAYGLVIIGAINWGLIGLVNVNLISSFFGEMSFFSRIIFILIGAGGFYLIYLIYNENG